MILGTEKMRSLSVVSKVICVSGLIDLLSAALLVHFTVLETSHEQLGGVWDKRLEGKRRALEGIISWVPSAFEQPYL